MSRKTCIRFGGFGGQGIITASIVLGHAAVVCEGKDAVQTQSFGQQARGGECKSEIIISDTMINYYTMEKADVQVIMSKPALERYLDGLRLGGCLIIDSDIVVSKPKRKDIQVVEIPATSMAARMGKKLVANMVMLGALIEKTEVVAEESLQKAIRDLFPSVAEINIKAAEEGRKLMKLRSGGKNANLHK
ncbi:MAG: 2-oxoacid:acceptor oxidoreductase family protein [Candidatus Bathyarchaeota archaeon]|nr:2-oxoacid:acceptor oxidoreductase family protein [Candidatus Bathyarchaeota archaeon]MDH5745361.1 2-oxoacid:acceptor oxidoreductase family protein [Candidatus Bathyarchaeota archaeon]